MEQLPSMRWNKQMMDEETITREGDRGREMANDQN